MELISFSWKCLTNTYIYRYTLYLFVVFISLDIPFFSKNEFLYHIFYSIFQKISSKKDEEGEASEEIESLKILN